MTRIVTYAHRYKRPPLKRKAVAPEQAVVITKGSRRPVSRDAGLDPACHAGSLAAMTDARHGLPTPHTTLRARYVVLLVWCKGGCHHQAEVMPRGLPAHVRSRG